MPVRRWLSRLLGGQRHVPAIEDAVAEDVVWCDRTPVGGFRSMFSPADETEEKIAAVNRIAAGSLAESDRDLMRTPFAGPLSVSHPAFAVDDVPDGFRCRHLAGALRRWVVFCSREPLTGDWAITFDYTPHGEFKEQVQIDFGTSSLGERLRFMVRRNRLLVFSRVEDGFFLPDDREIPFQFEIGKTYRLRIETCGGVHSLSVDGQRLLSVRTRRSSEGYVLLIFYEDGNEKPIDFSLTGFRYLASQGERPITLGK